MTKNTTIPSDRRSLSVLFSNLAKAAEKQQKEEERGLFSFLADRFRDGPAAGGSLADLKEKIAADIPKNYKEINLTAAEKGDRGILRALRWGEKVTTLQKSLIDRFLDKGDALLEGNDLFVCEACGFVFLGSQVPEICPVCKAPSKRFTKVK
jgi:rubrerythrin